MEKKSSENLQEAEKDDTRIKTPSEKVQSDASSSRAKKYNRKDNKNNVTANVRVKTQPEIVSDKSIGSERSRSPVLQCPKSLKRRFRNSASSPEIVKYKRRKIEEKNNKENASLRFFSFYILKLKSEGIRNASNVDEWLKQSEISCSKGNSLFDFSFPCIG